MVEAALGGAQALPLPELEEQDDKALYKEPNVIERMHHHRKLCRL